MACIFQSDVYGEQECKNLSFYRKLLASKIQSIIGANQPFALFGCQENGGAGLTLSDEGTGLDATLSSVGIWTGDGWYVPTGRPLSAGMWGHGLAGLVNHHVAIPNSSAINLSGSHKATWLVTFKCFDSGQGGAGRICEKAGSQILFTNDQVGQACRLNLSLMNGGWGSLIPTNRDVKIGYWHQVKITVDTDLAAGSRGHINFDGRDVPLADTIGNHIEDPGNPLRLLNETAGPPVRAFGGVVGAYCLIPDVAISDASFATMLELGSMFQYLAANQTSIERGPWDTPVYRFVRANDDHFASFQAQPFKTETGSIILTFTPQDMTNQQMLFGLTEDGNANGHELGIQLRGDLAGDPIEWHGRSAGAADLRLQIPFGAGRLNQPCIVAFTSNGTRIRGFVNGEEQVVTAVLGANTGQWFADYANSNVVVWGVTRAAALSEGLQGTSGHVVAYDREIVPMQMQQIQGRGGDLRWLPKK